MNEKRFREIYEQYYRLVKSVAFSVLKDYDFAEDVSQEVFLLFSQKVETLKEEYYNQWFLVNTKRKAIDFCRKAYQVHEVAASMCPDEDGGHLDNAAEWLGDIKQNLFEDEIAHKIMLRELTGKLFEDLANKNSEWYEIMMRTVVEGESTEEVARALGISIGNLRAKKHRRKKWIKENFKETYEESGLFQ